MNGSSWIGSTKVFKIRRVLPDHAPAPTISALPSGPPTTRQHLSTTIQHHSSLFLLPCPVTCFASARYIQKQTFNLSKTSNLVLLDWFTSGRMERGEEWLFSSYSTLNEVFVDGQRIARDAQLLKDDHTKAEGDHEPSPHITSYLSRVAPYSCYATIIIVGPSLVPLLDYLSKTFSSITQYPQPLPYSLLWSFSPLTSPGERSGGIIRVAGASTEEVREWIRINLERGGMKELLGVDLWNVSMTG